MLSLLNALHAMAARRGEGLHPELAARLEQHARNGTERPGAALHPDHTGQQEGAQVVQVDLGVMLFRHGCGRIDKT
ncbi:hypothetical protein [uncultured Phyllobacterium sp.]|uniref:hypothetical protein n=1 Tax=uncultured Phyllobacterium sp. TaxID=253813 RepID=UPI00258C3DD7|nr:hypothetical protein [uncultured Phyllobacterium sp.]